MRKRAVVKLDANGQVVEEFVSVTEAARKEYISHSAMLRRCLGRLDEPRRLNGYDYRYKDLLPDPPTRFEG